MRFPARLRLVLMVVALALLGWNAYAQTTIAAPAPRFVAPGDYVTLVFTVHPRASGVAGLTFTAPEGWQVLGARDSAAVTTGQPLPLAITIAVPDGAEPNTSNSVDLSVRLNGRITTASVQLSVLPRPNVALDLPSEVPIDAGQVTATITNTGNVTLHLTVTFKLDSKTLDTRNVVITRQQKQTVTFDVHRRGSHDVVVKSTASVAVTRSVNVLAYGVPAPPPFKVQTQLSTSLTSEGTWQVDATGRGPLSDYASLDARLSASSPTSSFLRIDGPAWTARIGSDPGAPFDLSLPAPFGLSGEAGGDTWDAFLGTGNIQADQWAGYAGGAWVDPRNHVTVAAGAASDRGRPRFSVSASQALQDKHMQARLDYIDGSVHASAHADARSQGEQLNIDAQAGRDTTGTPDAGVSVYYSAGITTFHASGRVNPATNVVGTASTGFRIQLPSLGLGQVQLGSDVGTEASAITLEQQGKIGGWTTSNDLAVRWDQDGNNLALATAWQRAGTNYVGGYARVRVGLDSGLVDVTGGVRGQAAVGPVLLFGAVAADGVSREASVRAGAQLTSGPLNLALSGNLSSPYADLGNPSGSVQLRANYAFPILVPAGITSLAGGRRKGTLLGTVSGASGIEGLVVNVGPYRLRVDKGGRFTAKLPPGEYRVGLAASTVPVRYRIDGPARKTVMIHAKMKADVAFGVVPAAGVTGHVLQDGNGDGNPDRPATGVKARVTLVDSQGLVHSAESTNDGAFSFGGLPPGKVTLSVSGLPLGQQAESSSGNQAFTAQGAVSDVTLLVTPATAHAQVFGGATLRIRNMKLETTTVPPGSSPRVSVTLSGAAQSVTVKSGNRSVELRKEGGAWTGRVPVPRNAKAGLYLFHLTAKADGEEAQGTGRLIVDPQVPLARGHAVPVTEGQTSVAIRVTVLAKASSVTVASDAKVGVSGDLREASPGTWTGKLSVASGLSKGSYSLDVAVHLSDHSVHHATLTMQVIPPPK